MSIPFEVIVCAVGTNAGVASSTSASEQNSDHVLLVSTVVLTRGRPWSIVLLTGSLPTSLPRLNHHVIYMHKSPIYLIIT
jgi:hypothetical protein